MIYSSEPIKFIDQLVGEHLDSFQILNISRYLRLDVIVPGITMQFIIREMT